MIAHADVTRRSLFAIEVNFGAFVDVVRNDELLVDVLTATAVRNKLAWAPTTAADRVDENLNGAGQKRIGVSSSVKAPS